jgi:hypothetical protein
MARIMKSVGIRVLKNQLSKYIGLVQQGETILVTDRDEVVAEIRRPSPWHLPDGDPEWAFLSRLAVLYDLRPPTALLWKEERLCSCRTSAALHVATALWLHRESGRPVLFASLDQRQRQVAAACGLPLLPESL